MLSLLASSALTLICALALGQAVMRAIGGTAFTWLSAPVGAVIIMLLAVPALHVPGRAATMGVVVVLLTVGALVWLVPSPEFWPSASGLLAGLPVLLLSLLPFAASGRAGTLGVSFNNDMAGHLLLAESHKTERFLYPGALGDAYPIGMHAWAAVSSVITNASTDLAFAGVTVALPILLGWTALAAITRPRAWGAFVVLPIVGLPFLVAGYFGQGSFKELAMAMLVLACAIVLAWPPTTRPSLRWVPFALLVTGCVSVYSYSGVIWPVGFLVVWLSGRTISSLSRGQLKRPNTSSLRRVSTAVAIGVGVGTLALVPQFPRILRLYGLWSAKGTGTGVAKSELGNLAGPLPFWESLGVWSSADFRVVGPNPLTTGALAGMVLVLVLFGAAWSLRRREWMLPGAAAFAVLIWFFSNASQSPYHAAKALVIATPLIMLLAARPLAESDEPGFLPMPAWWKTAAPLLSLALLFMLMPSTIRALRFSFVADAAHARQLQSIQALFGPHDKVIFLGNDDFIQWELRGTNISAPVIGFPTMNTRAEKPWAYGKNIDLDSLPAEVMNEYGWVIAPRDASGSIPAPELRLARQTPDFNVYRRTAPSPPTRVLPEGEAAALRLDCESKEGRDILRAGGVAAVRPPPVTLSGPSTIAPGKKLSVPATLSSGRWDLVVGYTGPRPLAVTGPGLKTTVPASLDRPGPRWPVGRIKSQGTPTVLTFSPEKTMLTLPSALTAITSVTAVPVGKHKIVHVRSACNKYVDWYRPGTTSQ